MKKLIFITCLLIVLAGCNQQANTNNANIINVTEQQSYQQLLAQSLKDNNELKEVANPNLSLPDDINANQLRKYFQIGDIYLALALQNSVNVPLELPANFNLTFSGILIAEQGDANWTKYWQIKDKKETDKNNPYYLWQKDGQLQLNIVDQNGAGSGEGMLKVFRLNEDNWELYDCYYFGEKYKDAKQSGDYFAYTLKLNEQKYQPLEVCAEVDLEKVLN